MKAAGGDKKSSSNFIQKMTIEQQHQQGQVKNSRCTKGQAGNKNLDLHQKM